MRNTLFFPLVLLTTLFSAQGAFADKYVDLLKSLVEVNSGSENTEGVKKVQILLEAEFKKRGFQTELIYLDQSAKSGAPLLLGTLVGQGDKYITLAGHADTVFEPSSPFQHLAFSGGDKLALGPGVIDDKGGIVVALHALDILLKERKSNPLGIRVIISPSEELGSKGFQDLFKKYARDSHVVLGMEPALDDGGVIKSRKGNRWYEISVTGKEAHSGKSHKEGVNACQELADKLSLISKLTDYKRGTTVSIGHMEGGQDKFNIVCGDAYAMVDTRFSDQKSGDELHAKIQAILKKVFARSFEFKEPAKTTFKIEDETPAFIPSAKAEKYLSHFIKLVYEIERRKISAQATGGTADVNFFSQTASVVFDGMGPVGGKMHTSEEFLVLSSLETRAQTLARLMDFIFRENE